MHHRDERQWRGEDQNVPQRPSEEERIHRGAVAGRVPVDPGPRERDRGDERDRDDRNAALTGERDPFPRRRSALYYIVYGGGTHGKA